MKIKRINGRILLFELFILMCITYKVYGMPQSMNEACHHSTSSAPVEITISAVGDCTIGYDENFGFKNSYDDVIDRMGFDYPFKNVLDIFKSDDITVINLETTFTDAEFKADKEFRFKGKPEYANIIKNSSIECANISNNHTHDYLDQGYKDTIMNLQKAGIGYFGDGTAYIKDIRGVKVGFLGFKGWGDEDNLKRQIKSALEDMKKTCRIAIVSFHWGVERENYPCSFQTDLGRYAVDCGADLVIGHHPHVIQGIEEYKNRHIVYSLGNFSYGGHKNPSDKDTFIFVEKFTVSETSVNISKTEMVPCSISSKTGINNYQPTPLKGAEAEKVIGRLRNYSLKLPYGYDFGKISVYAFEKPLMNIHQKKELIIDLKAQGN